MESKRMKLKITEVGTKKQVGQATKTPFKATDGEREYQYFTFSNRLAEHLKVDTEIDCDIEVSSREYDGNTYIDRKLVQIYENNEPVIKKSGYSERSKESFAEFHLRQKSIERQNALTNAVTFWTKTNTGEISTQQILYTAEDFFLWTSQGLIPTSTQKAVEPLPSLPQSVTEASVKTPEDYKKSVNDLCQKLKWKTSNFKAFLEANKNKLGGTDFATFTDTQKVLLIKLMNDELKEAK